LHGEKVWAIRSGESVEFFYSQHSVLFRISNNNYISDLIDLPEPSLPNIESLSYHSRTLSLTSPGGSAQRQDAPAIEADPWAATPPATNGLSDSPYGTITHVPPVDRHANDNMVRRDEFRWHLNHREQITVNFASEREGFLFMKHVNYIVECSVINSPCMKFFVFQLIYNTAY
jgi:hypothetical protein